MSSQRTARRCLAAALLWCFVATAGAQTPEFRGLWVDTFNAGMKNSSQVSALVNTARSNNFNAIIVEVRKRGDAYYNSTIEPKASDVAPQSFDPLADLLTKAHTGGRRIEVHAWMTTYLIWNSEGASPSQTNHPYLTHPEWLSVDNTGANWDGGNYQFDAALPGVQKHVYGVAMDIVSRYDVDGLHFDYVRYSGKEWGYHTNALERFRRRYNFNGTPATTDANWLQFRRDQVSGLVRKVYLNAIALKPQMKISAATICFAPGITTDAQWFSGSSAWTDVLQDWRGWMREGILDLNIPMAYFRQPVNGADWAAWSLFAKEHTYGHQVAMGQGSYLNALTNVITQLRTVRVPTVNSNATAAGMAIYSYAFPATTNTTAATVFNALINPTSYDTNPVPLFATAVGTPVMTWKTAPIHGHVKGTIRVAATSNELDGAIVTLSGPVTRIQTNDATGFYGFAHLPPGNYTVTATYSNLTSQSAPVIIATGVVSTVDFSLSASNGPLLNLQAYPGRTEAILAWTTTNASDSQVEFGLTAALGNFNWRDTNAVTNHAVLITGLLPNTNYFYRALTRTGAVTNSSATNTFRTAGEIVMDNGAASFTGTWTAGTSALDKFGADYLFASTVSSATATYTPAISTPGRYDVTVWYPQGGNRSTNAPFVIAHSGGTVNGAVNQQINGGGWRVVATNLAFARGPSGFFQWQSGTDEASRVVMADGVRFSYATNQEPPAPGGVPQWWGNFFFGEPVSAGLDPDVDGFSTEREYLAGTDPLRAASRLRYRIEDHTSNTLRMSFSPSHGGRAYELQAQTMLSTNGWAGVSTAPQTLINGDGVFAVTNLTGQKLYRLRVQLLP